MAANAEILFPEYTLTPATRAFLGRANRMLIGGKWVKSTSGESFDVTDPATTRVITSVPAGDKADIDKAVIEARKALEDSEWSRMVPSDRELLLLKLADLIEANLEELAQIESLDNGKTVAMARIIDVGSSVSFVRYIAGWATKIEGSTISTSPHLGPDARIIAYTLKEPVGVVGSIIPWNFPLAMALWKVCPALATGSTVVLKPAEQTPLSALRLGELILEAGFPPGVVNIVTGMGETAGAALAGHPGIDKIAFTGSTEIGKLIARYAADNVTRLSLELGGKSPVIVLPDADIDMAIMGAANGILFNCGQVCTAGSRLYVHKKVYADVVDGIAEIAKGMKLGPGLKDDSQLGPLVSREQQDRVTGFIKSGVADGARVVCGGDRANMDGYFVNPTILADAGEDMEIVREEIFGPVLAAASFDDLDDVVKRANSTKYGLAASIWSKDLGTVHRLIPRIKAGTVWVNMHNMIDPALPFGGFKQSGIGREMSRMVIDMYTETKSVMMSV